MVLILSSNPPGVPWTILPSNRVEILPGSLTPRSPSHLPGLVALPKPPFTGSHHVDPRQSDSDDGRQSHWIGCSPQQDICPGTVDPKRAAALNKLAGTSGCASCAAILRSPARPSPCVGPDGQHDNQGIPKPARGHKIQISYAGGSSSLTVG